MPGLGTFSGVYQEPGQDRDLYQDQDLANAIFDKQDRDQGLDPRGLQGHDLPSPGRCHKTQTSKDYRAMTCPALAALASVGVLPSPECAQWTSASAV